MLVAIAVHPPVAQQADTPKQETTVPNNQKQGKREQGSTSASSNSHELGNAENKTPENEPQTAANVSQTASNVVQTAANVVQTASKRQVFAHLQAPVIQLRGSSKKPGREDADLVRGEPMMWTPEK
jgi:hypothetical protein